MYPILAVLVLGATPPVGPLTCETPLIDRGEVRTGPLLTQVFELNHSGAANTVTITGVESGCGCLKPTVNREVLLPGQSTRLTLTVNTLTQPAGPNSWRVLVRYRVMSLKDAPTTES